MARKRVVTAAALLSISALLALGLAELVLRSLYPLPLDYLSPQVRYVDHPARRFTIRADQQAFTYTGAVSIGSQGFRETPGNPASEDADVTILALGDSFTFGMGVDDNETWPSQLRGSPMLAGLGNVRMINGGTISYGVEQELDLLLEKGIQESPDLVVHALYWNDYMPLGSAGDGLESVLTADGYFKWDKPPPEDGPGYIRRAIRANSVLAYLAMQTVRQLSVADQPSGTSSYEEAYQAMIAGDVKSIDFDILREFYLQLKNLGAEQQFCVYGVVLPVIGLVDSDAGEAHPFESEMSEMFDELGIPYLNGIERWRALKLRQETFLPYNRHLNKDGYSVLAREMADDIVRLANSCVWDA